MKVVVASVFTMTKAVRNPVTVGERGGRERHEDEERDRQVDRRPIERERRRPHLEEHPRRQQDQREADGVDGQPEPGQGEHRVDADRDEGDEQEEEQDEQPHAEPAVEDLDERQGQQADVEEQRAVADVREVVAVLVARRGVVAAAELGDAGDPRRHEEAPGVAGDLLAEALDEDGTHRARPHQPHVALDHVEQLRQLVELGPLEQPADRGAEDVAFVGADQAGADLPLGALEHRPEFVDGERAEALADPLAAVEDRARAGQLDEQGDRAEQGAEHQERQGAHDALSHRGMLGLTAVRRRQGRTPTPERRGGGRGWNSR
jgi:hypothetical protein